MEENKELFEKLSSALKSTHPEVRKEVIIMLGKTNDSRVPNLLTEFIARETDPAVKEIAAKVISDFSPIAANQQNTLENSVKNVEGAKKRSVGEKILLIDDDLDTLRLCGLMLAKQGYLIVAASNGLQGLGLALSEDPDLIILDVMMPMPTDGYEVARRLRASEITVNIPILMFTAKSQLDDKVTGFESGADDYLTKPTHPTELQAHIKALLARSSKAKLKPSEELRKHRADLLKQVEDEIAKSNPGESDQFPLAELSRITDGIVHDMRNGLGIIRNTIGFISDDLADTSHGKDILKISRSLDFCEVVLRNLSALGGQDIMQRESVNLESVIREICFMFENKLVDIQIVIDAGGENPVITTDEGHMKQVFMNLIKNAGEAMPDGGTLTCRLRRENDMMRIEIQDTGRGITEENQQRLFREFFTTKERGYGLGLFIVHTIVKRYGGEISVQSKVGQGTTFTLVLPVGVE